jgi:predicted RNA-binding Zn ribbon-like protein
VPRPQTLTTVKDVPLVGGSLCLDFVNTTGARASAAPRERLTCYGDLLTWSQRAGILDAKAAVRLRRAAASREDDAANALRRARKLREELYELLSAFGDGRRPAARTVARLAAHWRVARRNQELVLGRSGLEFRIVTNEVNLAGPISPIVAAAVDLLTSDRLLLIKRCAECDWLFLDTSKNGTRRWCKSTCGNRARSRERYGRVRRARPRRSSRAPN